MHQLSLKLFIKGRYELGLEQMQHAWSCSEGGTN